MDGVVLADGGVSHALAVDDVAAYGEVAQDAGGTVGELSGVYPRSNYPEFPDSCLTPQLPEWRAFPRRSLIVRMSTSNGLAIRRCFSQIVSLLVRLIRGGKGADTASPYVYAMSDGHRSATVAERVVGGAAAFIDVLAGIPGQ